MKKIVVMASGNGSNFENIFLNFKDKADVTLISDCPKAFVIERAKRLKAKFIVLDYRAYSTKREYNDKLLDTLISFEPDLIVLAGYMRLLPSITVKKFEKRIINIHPSLLPAFKGKNAIKKAFDYGVKITGVTVHYVNEEMDAGQIIEQVPLKIEENMTFKDLESAIHRIEHTLYSNVISKLIGG